MLSLKARHSLASIHLCRMCVVPSSVPRDLPADSSRLILHIEGLPRCVNIYCTTTSSVKISLGAAADSSTLRFARRMVCWVLCFFRSHRLFDSSQRLLGCSAFCRLRSADSRRSAYLARGFRERTASTLRCDPRSAMVALRVVCVCSMHVVCTQYVRSRCAVCTQYAHSMYVVCAQYVHSMYMYAYSMCTVCVQYVCLYVA